MAGQNPRTFIFLPPVRKPVGGVAVLRRIGALLRKAGREAWLAPREPGGWRPGEDSTPEIPFDALRLETGDLWLVPEGWVNALAPGLSAGARCLVYVQNWAYLFSGLPPGVDWRRLPVEFLAVSEPVAWFIRESLGVPAPILRPGIDPAVFAPPGEKPAEPTVAFMPRKNKALADQIRAVFEARNPGRARWLEIDGRDQAGVAGLLQQSHVFLATGFPEGCPLPPLEAMACGAVPVGCAGLGGWDYMRQADPGGFAPACPVRPVAWDGNGYYCPDGDVMGCVYGLEKALGLWRGGGEALESVLAAGRICARAYGLDEQERAVNALWEALDGRGGSAGS